MKVGNLLALIINCFLPLSFLFAQTSPQSEIFEVDLEGLNFRETVLFPENQKIIKVCDLEEGQNYVISVALFSSNTEIQNFQLKDLERNMSSREIHFFANESCHLFEYTQSFPFNVILSIHKQLIDYQSTAPTNNTSTAAPISVSGGGAQHLIENVFIGGGCFDVTNVSLTGPGGAIGEFSNGSTSIGIEDGVVISTGHRNNILGPNDETGEGTNFPGSSFDSDLQQVVNSTGGGGVVQERTIIEFDFTPTVNTISFEYVFASEEYCDYVNASFNDAFGFFISGPGITGTFSNAADNIALIPGTSSYVTINSVNFTSNSAYYIDNVPIGQAQDANGCVPAELANPAAAPNDIQFDGYTTVLTATANVIPCSTYHIKLAVGDLGDGNFDSAVFLKANSFDAGGKGSGEAINSITGTNIFYEQCGGTGGITFEISGADPTLPFNITYTIDPNSTATAGVDYLVLPNPVIVPAGQTTITIPMTVIDDGIGEGQENIILLLDNPCSCTDAEIEIIIDEVQPMMAEMPDQTLCAAQSVTLTPTITGGLQGGNFTYNWNDGSTGSSNTDTPAQTTTYVVTVTDDCGTTTVESAVVTVEETSTAMIMGNYTICASAPAPMITIPVTFTGTGPWTFVYAIDGVDQAPITTSDNPYDLMVTAAGSVSLVSVESGMLPNGGACPGIVAGNVPISEVTITPSLTPTPETCIGSNNGEVSVSVSGGMPNYSYNWSNGGGNSPTQTNLPPGFYEVTVTDADGCTGVSSTDITSPPPISGNATGQEANCSNNGGGSISASGSGGTPGYTYNWSNGDSGSNLSNIPPGTYTVTISDINGCTTEAIASVDDNTAPPIANANGNGIIDCITQNIQIDGNGSTTGGSIDYQWSGPGIISGGTTLNPSVNVGGTYTIVVTDIDSGCTAEATVNIPQDNTPPIATGVGSDLDCNNITVQISGNGSSTGSNISYQWTGPGIISGGTTLNPTVNQPGSYTLVVTNNTNGCTAETTIPINSNAQIPTAIATGGQLDCTNSVIDISGNGSSTGNDYIYQWSGPAVLSGGTTINPTVGQPGTYTIVVTNTDTGCTNEATVNVIQDLNLPTAIINPVPPYGCTIGNQVVIANGSSGSNFSYNWSSSGGTIVGGGSTLNPTINGLGTYTLIITDNNNGCTAETSVTVGQQIILPIVNVAPPFEIDCNSPNVILDGSGSQSGGNINYTWFTNNGSIISGGGSNTAIVDAGGTYTLVVIDNNSGCTDEQTVNVVDNTNFPVADAGPNQEITCAIQTAILNGLGSVSGQNITTQWLDVNGNLIDVNPVTTVNSAGTYELVVTDLTTGCTGSDIVVVEANDELPSATILTPEELNCNNNFVTIFGNTSNPGLQILWTTNDGNIVSGATSLNPVVNSEGTYQLTLLDPQTGCANDFTIQVNENIELPEVAIIPPPIVDCATPEVVIDASNSASGGNYEYAWSTNNGSIVSGGNTLTPIVNTGGFYNLVITNLDNGCTNGDFTVAVDNFSFPDIEIENPDLITCVTNQVTLNASNSSIGNNYQYSWFTNTNGIVSGENSLNPVVNETGLYELVITDLTSSCTVSEFVEVFEDSSTPTANAGQPDLLDCITPSVILNGGATGSNNLSIEWTTGDGNILNGANTLTPEINEAGTYLLTVINLDNNCEALSEVIIDEDVEIPYAEIFPTTKITCTNPTLVLDASNSASDPNLNYSWTATNGGTILNGANTLFPEIGTEGTYILNIFNPNNNCNSSAEISVEENNEIPTADAGDPKIMGCGDDFVNLNGSANSNSNPFLNIEWTTNNGSISGDPTTLNTIVNEPGIYQINVTDPINGCTASAQVEITQNLETPEIAIGDGGEITCNQLSIDLNSTVIGNLQNYVYQWQTNSGNIATGATSLTPNVDAAGIYTLMVVDTINNCSDVDSLLITEDADIPEALIDAEGSLNCVSDSIILNASNSTTGAGISFEWTTNNGNFLDGQTTLNPTINQPGLYTLTIIDSNNDCTNSTGISVEMDTLAPATSIANPDILTCATLEVGLDGSNSSLGGNFTITWSTDDGQFVSGTDSLNPIVNQPGFYDLHIVNNSNGCESETSIEVTEQTEVPILIIQEPDELNCYNTSLSLNATESDNAANFQFEWTTDIGNIVTGGDALNPVINEPGTYNLLITNTLNGCTTEDLVTVSQDIENPESKIEPTDILTCETLELILSGENSSIGNIYEYQWSNSNGNPILDETTLNPTIQEPGFYHLLVTNISNGCIDLDSIFIDQNIEHPVADAGNENELTCSIIQLNLDGNLSTQNTQIEFLWTSNDGNIIEGSTTLNPLIDEPGVYNLQVLDTENGCLTTAEVLITQDTNIPEADAGIANDLTCVVEEILLNAENSATGNDITYFWSTNNGNILNGDTTLTPIINEPGTYTLLVSDTGNDCFSSSTVVVAEDLVAPDANAGQTAELTCVVETLELNGEQSSTGNNFAYFWSTNDGNILSGETSIFPIIDAPGIYQIVVTDEINGCTAENFVEITQSLEVPEAVINAPAELNCVTDELILDASPSSQGIEFQYLWSTQNGTIISGETSLNPIISAPGIYQILVTNSNNGCANSFPIEVIENLVNPDAEAGQTNELTCTSTDLELNGEGSSIGNNYTYLWSTQTGNISVGNTSLNPTITAPGIYQILVTDEFNGCTSTDFVEITADEAVPFAVIAQPDLLTCAVETILINATNSSQGTDFEYIWTTSNGNILNGDTSLEPSINQPGTYQLVVTNNDNGCVSSSEITVNQNIELPTVDAGDPFTFNCYEDIQFLEGTAFANGDPISYNWTSNNGIIANGQNNATLGVQSGGLYHLSVTNTLTGCENSDEVVVVEDFPVASRQTHQPICFNDLGSIGIFEVEGGTAPYVFSIDGGENYFDNTLFSDLPAGIYEVAVQDANGCEEIQDVELIQPDEVNVVIIQAETTIKQGESVQLNVLTNIPEDEIAQIVWTPSHGLSCTDCLNPIATPFNTVIYKVEITSIKGCSDATPYLLQVDKNVEIHVPNIFSPNGDGDNDVFMIFSKAENIKEIRSFLVFNRWGESVFQYFHFLPNNPAYGWDGLHRGKVLNPAVFAWFAEVEFIDGRVELLEGDVTLVK